MRMRRWFQDAAQEQQQAPPMPGADGWAAAAAARLSAPQWQRLAALDLGADAGSRPWQNPEWRARIEAHRGDHRTVAAVQQLVAALCDAVPLTPPAPGGAAAADARPILVCEDNTAIAVNALWAAARYAADPQRTARTAGAILRRAVAEPWCVDSPRLRAACIGVLGEARSAQAADELVEAAGLALDKPVRAQILLAVDRLASADAPHPGRVAELRVPRYGLDDEARLALSVHGCVYALELLPSGEVRVERTADADTPGDEHARHAVGKRAREIRAAYVRELERIEDLLAAERTWPLPDWRRLYLRHPITRSVACALVWRLRMADAGSVEVIPAPAGGVRAVDGRIADTAWAIPEQGVTGVELWHPGTASVQSLTAWRALLPGLARQPFAQIGRWHARRLPDPERTQVADYLGWESDRAQFEETARAVRWRWQPAAPGARPRRDADRVPGGSCAREYPEASLACALEVVLDGDTVRCGQARFHRLRDREREPVPLGAVPDRVYSEALRALAQLAGARLTEDATQDLPVVADAPAAN